jgi:hypothetical protein
MPSTTEPITDGAKERFDNGGAREALPVAHGWASSAAQKV